MKPSALDALTHVEEAVRSDNRAAWAKATGKAARAWRARAFAGSGVPGSWARAQSLKRVSEQRRAERRPARAWLTRVASVLGQK